MQTRPPNDGPVTQSVEELVPAPRVGFGVFGVLQQQTSRVVCPV